ncbi:hypothetical protein XSR1_160011 [Xenorhabdus szentirmaii DSM 16338]|uniref:Uncharacterized protein n=1 Tax=Xenorhabdus szentirmaii DSM 16338 TaxID=1427518 RepID=W1ITG9_9GAMM|nr:hypothetical protein XSR1_160011 [Xenorhabdus szentirmaii DSM 16338]
MGFVGDENLHGQLHSAAKKTSIWCLHAESELRIGAGGYVYRLWKIPIIVGCDRDSYGIGD